MDHSLHARPSGDDVTRGSGIRCGLDLAFVKPASIRIWLRANESAAWNSTPADDCNVLVAIITAAVCGGFRHRPGHFVRIDAPVFFRAREFPRPAVGVSGLGAACPAAGKASIHAAMARRICNDEYPRLCRRGLQHQKIHAGYRGNAQLHNAPRRKRDDRRFMVQKG